MKNKIAKAIRHIIATWIANEKTFIESAKEIMKEARKEYEQA